MAAMDGAVSVSYVDPLSDRAEAVGRLLQQQATVILAGDIGVDNQFLLRESTAGFPEFSIHPLAFGRSMCYSYCEE